MWNFHRQQWLRLLCATSLVSLSSLTHGVNFHSAANPSASGSYYQPDYPLIFVSSPITTAPLNSGSGVKGTYHLGTDVISAANPSAGAQL